MGNIGPKELNHFFWGGGWGGGGGGEEARGEVCHVGRTYSPSLARFPVLELLLMATGVEYLIDAEGEVLPVSPMLLTLLASFFFHFRPKLTANDSVPLFEMKDDKRG